MFSTNADKLLENNDYIGIVEDIWNDSSEKFIVVEFKVPEKNISVRHGRSYREPTSNWGYALDKFKRDFGVTYDSKDELIGSKWSIRRNPEFPSCIIVNGPIDENLLKEKIDNRSGSPSQKTYYDNIVFRSKLEAQWAMFFDLLGIDWEYEPNKNNLELVDLGDGIFYSPDFRLKNVYYSLKNEVTGEEELLERELWVEVKGKMNAEDARKIDYFAYGNKEERLKALEKSFDKEHSYLSKGQLNYPVVRPILVVGELPSENDFWKISINRADGVDIKYKDVYNEKFGLFYDWRTIENSINNFPFALLFRRWEEGAIIPKSVEEFSQVDFNGTMESADTVLSFIFDHEKTSKDPTIEDIIEATIQEALQRIFNQVSKNQDS